jgi:glycosyltransferase involved in cell wall biosynthesis
MAALRDAGACVNVLIDKLRKGLRWRLRATVRLWSLGKRPDMPFLAAPPPAEPFPYQGLIDGPSYITEEMPEATGPIEVKREMLNIRGWATFRAGPTARVEVFFDDELLGRGRLGVPRPDVTISFDEPYVEISGWEIDVPTQTLAGDGDREGQIHAVAVGPNGERHELAPVEVIIRAAAARDSDAAEIAPAVVRPRFSGRGGTRVLVITHQLTLGGAQLYLMDLLREQHALGLIDPIVVSSFDGPLRKDLEAMDIPVHLTNLTPSGKLGTYRGRLEEFIGWAAPLDAEMIFVNTSTSTTFSAGEIAVALGIPSVWAIHESFHPALLWFGLDPILMRHAESVIGTATSAIFEADATRHMYEGMIPPERCRTIPYGLDLEPIDRERADFDPTAARRKAGIPADARLVVCIGTIEPRKAQIPLAEAFDLIGSSHPSSRLVFVGGRDEDPNTIALEECIERSPRRDQMEVIPVTPDVASWYGMADLLVSASDVESLPRTVLEAMAWGTPVLATDVFGLPELIGDGETGWLCEARDVRALADSLDRALSAEQSTYGTIARNARGLVETRHSLRGYAEEVARQFEAAITEYDPNQEESRSK